jgi:hypothetical protein
MVYLVFLTHFSSLLFLISFLSFFFLFLFFIAFFIFFCILFVRFSKESDYSVWCERLIIDELELSDIKNVERYCEYLSNKYDRIHILINNAAQTITRPTGWLNKMDTVNKNATLMLTCGDISLSSDWNVSLNRQDRSKLSSNCCLNSNNTVVQKIKNEPDGKYCNNNNNNDNTNNNDTNNDDDIDDINNDNNGDKKNDNNKNYTDDMDNGSSNVDDDNIDNNNNSNNNNINNDNNNNDNISNISTISNINNNNNNNNDNNNNTNISNYNSTVMVTLDDSAQPLDKSGKYTSAVRSQHVHSTNTRTHSTRNLHECSLSSLFYWLFLKYIFLSFSISLLFYFSLSCFRCQQLVETIIRGTFATVRYSVVLYSIV